MCIRDSSISSVDAEGAYKNLQAEMPGWNFDGVRADAKKKWNECLSKMCIRDRSDRQHNQDIDKTQEPNQQRAEQALSLIHIS